jgi:hypothetical protein
MIIAELESAANVDTWVKKMIAMQWIIWQLGSAILVILGIKLKSQLALCSYIFQTVRLFFKY